MKIFKKRKNINQKDVAINPKEDIINSEADELKVEIRNYNYIIFSDSNSKYLCMNKDFENIISIDGYVVLEQDSVILKKGNLNSLLYWNDECRKYILTDFKFVKIVEDNYNSVIVLSDVAGNKYLYSDSKIYENILDYTPFSEYKLLKISFPDHEELYYKDYMENILLFSARSIEYCTNINKGICSRTIPLFKYKDLNSNLFGCFEVRIKYKDFFTPKLYASLDVIYYNGSEIAIIATDENNKKYVFNYFIENKTNKCYDNIQNINKFFLCKDGNHLEIIDIKHNVYYENDFEDISNISLSYSEVSDNYVLSCDDFNIVSLQLFYDDINILLFYTILDEESHKVTFHIIKNKFEKSGFIRKIDSSIFEFEDVYLLIKNSVYYFYSKALVENVNKMTLSALKEVLYFNYENVVFYLDENIIDILKKCNIVQINEVLRYNGLTIVKAYTSLFDIIIYGNKIRVELYDGSRLILNADDITTTLNDYVFEHITNKFHLALLKYKLKKK